jgi:hypothetical protein
MGHWYEVGRLHGAYQSGQVANQGMLREMQSLLNADETQGAGVYVHHIAFAWSELADWVDPLTLCAETLRRIEINGVEDAVKLAVCS